MERSVNTMGMTEKLSSRSSLPSVRGTKYQRVKQWMQGPTRRARWTRGFVYFCLPMLIVVAFGMSIGWSFRTPDLNTPPPAAQFAGRQIDIILVLQAMDPLTGGGVVTLTWWIGSDSCVAEGGNADTCPPVNIYMDPNLFAGQYATPQQPASNGIPSSPTFQLFAPTDWRNPLARYTTQLAVATRSYQPADTLLNYPFDRYVTEIVAYAQVNGTNEYVGLNVVQATGVAFGFDTVVPSAARVLKDFGVAVVGNEGVQGGPEGSLQLPLEIRRTILVQAYVVSLILAMWLITLCLLGIAIKATFLRYEVDVAILVAPVATLFAFTTLRQAMPGSPSGFGAIIDFVGTLPSLAVLIAITVVCLFHALVLATKHENKELRPAECKCRSDS